MTLTPLFLNLDTLPKAEERVLFFLSKWPICLKYLFRISKKNKLQLTLKQQGFELCTSNFLFVVGNLCMRQADCNYVFEESSYMRIFDCTGSTPLTLACSRGDCIFILPSILLGFWSYKKQNY